MYEAVPCQSNEAVPCKMYEACLYQLFEMHLCQSGCASFISYFVSLNKVLKTSSALLQCGGDACVAAKRMSELLSTLFKLTFNYINR